MRRLVAAVSRTMPDSVALAALTLGSAILGCHEDQSAGPAGPRIVTLAIAANPANALSSLVTYTAPGSDSARVYYWSVGGPDTAPGSDVARVRYWSDRDPAVQTPFIASSGGTGTVPVLGLRPRSLYQAVLEVKGAGGTTSSAPLELRTGDLPAALQNVHLSLSGPGTPPPGFLLTSVTAADTAFAVAFDSSGAIHWYRGFPAQSGEHALACEQQPNGNFTLFVGASSGWQPVAGRYYEFTPAGDSVGTYTAGAPYYTDPHEVLVRGAGGGHAADTAVYLLGYDLRSMDLTSIGGGPSQIVAGHSILGQSVDGMVRFRWSAWDHFTIDDWVGRPPNLAQTAQLDFDHANSIELDAAGDYVVSFAAVTQVVKIDHATGALRWRFGGRRNQFTLVGDELSGFGIQHDARLLPDGDLLLFDNGNFHNPPESRAVEYRLDTLAMTATLVWEYRHNPPVYAPFVGSAQRYGNGHTLVGFGAAGIMTEVAADGAVVWEGRLTAAGQPAIFYRVRELSSLYVHQQP